MNESCLVKAVSALASAEALLIGAGAGMGVDSGLPDFRGRQGFWQAYPPYQKLGLNFQSLANPYLFTQDPTLAWGFYGQRLHLYRATQPHDGFQILRLWAERMERGAFIFTSNVDGHFQRAGFPAECVHEVHGTLEWLQCTRHCGIGLFPSTAVDIFIDEETMRAREPLPLCPGCGALARPNVLMFGDYDWDPVRSAEQQDRLEAWLSGLGAARLIVIECGAGTAIPTVRRFCEEIAKATDARLLRINLREHDVPHGHLGLAEGALKALRALHENW